MAHYQSRTPKRHIAWSNSSKIGLFNMGRLTGFDYQSAEYKKHKTATTKVSKSGKKSFQGRKKELKASQCLRRKFTSKGAHAFIYIYISHGLLGIHSALWSSTRKTYTGAFHMHF